MEKYSVNPHPSAFRFSYTSLLLHSIFNLVFVVEKILYVFYLFLLFFLVRSQCFFCHHFVFTDRRSVIDIFWTVGVVRWVMSIVRNFGRVLRLMLSLHAVVELTVVGLVIVLVVIRSVYENALNSIWSAPVEMDLLPLRLLLADWLEQQLKN